MNTFKYMLECPTRDTVTDFLISCGLSEEQAKAQALRALRVDRTKANKLLSEQNYFDSYADAVNFIYNILDSCSYLNYMIDWPYLPEETPTRVVTSISDKSNLVVCLYRFTTGTVECIAYIS